MIKSSLKKAIKQTPLRFIKERYDTAQQRRQFQKHLRSSDVFIVGHPKSGNTWITLMLGVLIEKNFNRKTNLNTIGEFVPSFHNRDNQIADHSDLPNPRLFRNEAPLYPDLYPKTIYIVRDPRAAYVSYYHHCVHDTGRTDWKMEHFLKEMLATGGILSLEPYLVRWDRHVG